MKFKTIAETNKKIKIAAINNQTKKDNSNQRKKTTDNDRRPHTVRVRSLRSPISDRWSTAEIDRSASTRGGF